jgi:hypothetical protein
MTWELLGLREEHWLIPLSSSESRTVVPSAAINSRTVSMLWQVCAFSPV